MSRDAIQSLTQLQVIRTAGGQHRKLLPAMWSQVTPASCNSELAIETTDSQKTPRRKDQSITRHFPTEQQNEQTML